MIVNTFQLIEKLKIIEPEGLEVSLRFGVLTTTKALYLKKRIVFLFSMEEKFQFEDELGFSIEDFEQKHKKWYWNIEQIIS